MDPRQASAIAFHRKKAQAEKDHVIERNRLATAIDGDPQAVAEWRDSLVEARIGLDGQFYCVGHHPRGAFRYDVEPDTTCSRCERRIGAVQ